jgi:hypothetical protein
MIKVYLNSPNQKFTIHADPACSMVRMNQKEEQRIIHINKKTISQELENFLEKRYSFFSAPEGNDMWLEIDFRDEEFEKAAALFIKKLIGKNYVRISAATPTTHC